jgi:hypothetical protein
MSVAIKPSPYVALSLVISFSSVPANLLPKAFTLFLLASFFSLMLPFMPCAFKVLLDVSAVSAEAGAGASETGGGTLWEAGVGGTGGTGVVGETGGAGGTGGTGVVGETGGAGGVGGAEGVGGAGGVGVFVVLLILSMFSLTLSLTLSTTVLVTSPTTLAVFSYNSDSLTLLTKLENPLLSFENEKPPDEADCC